MSGSTTESGCNDVSIEDAALRDVMILCRKRYEVRQCGPLHFVFMYRYKGHTIPVTIEREGEKVIYRGNVNLLEKVEAQYVEEFRNLIENPKLRFHPGHVVNLDSSGKKIEFAVVRCDVEVDDIDPKKNQGRFITALINLKQILDKTPANLLPHP